MAITRQVWAVSVLLAACALDQGKPAETIPSDPNLDDEEVSTNNAMHFSVCELASPDCLIQSSLLDFWSCPSDKGYEIAVGTDGRIELLNHDGDHGVGCVACDGTFELVSDQDNLGAAWVKVGGTMAAKGNTLNVSWRECGTLDIETCRANPGPARSETCKRSE